ncbi:hypothetical protein ACFSM7_11485 [Clavibacter michiganensis subsp. tessellarius]|uniref:hypothetical protein n=1 Tax=Clavibacter tessellarius TaxID=31965 RepID=UPI0036273AC5
MTHHPTGAAMIDPSRGSRPARSASADARTRPRTVTTTATATAVRPPACARATGAAVRGSAR